MGRTGSKRDAGSGTLDRLLRDRVQELQACLSELSYCLDGHFLENAGEKLQERIGRLESSLQKLLRTLTPLPEGSRLVARDRGNALLDGVIAKKFNPGKINPYRLFRYAAERGITKLGKKGDQQLIVELSKVKKEAIIHPPTAFERSSSTE